MKGTKERSDALVDVVRKGIMACPRDSVLPRLNRMTLRDEMGPHEDFGIERINLPLGRSVCLGGKIPPTLY
jgi:hypothetical protein